MPVITIPYRAFWLLRPDKDKHVELVATVLATLSIEVIKSLPERVLSDIAKERDRSVARSSMRR